MIPFYKTHTVLQHDRATTKEESRLHIESFRRASMEALGNRCNEEGCTWNHPDVLEIDHIIPAAITRRGSPRDASYHLYRKILNMQNPRDEFQLLCANHHRLKTVKDREDLAAAKEEAKGYVDEGPLEGLQNMDE